MSLSFEVVLLGESGVGKTSIINKCYMIKFNEKEPATNNYDWIPKNVKIKDKTIPLIIWDTAGGEKYRKLLEDLFKKEKMNVFVFVYDITKIETFEKIKTYWLNKTGANAPNDKSKQKLF